MALIDPASISDFKAFSDKYLADIAKVTRIPHSFLTADTRITVKSVIVKPFNYHEAMDAYLQRIRNDQAEGYLAIEWLQERVILWANADWRRVKRERHKFYKRRRHELSITATKRNRKGNLQRKHAPVISLQPQVW